MLIRILFLALSFSAGAAEVVVPKAKFSDEIKAGMPGAFCTDKSFFRTCFDVNADGCKKAVATATADCWKELEKDIPAQLHQPADGQEWGKKLGSCAGKKYATDLQKNKKESAECNDPAKWQ